MIEIHEMKSGTVTRAVKFQWCLTGLTQDFVYLSVEQIFASVNTNQTALQDSI